MARQTKTRRTSVGQEKLYLLKAEKFLTGAKLLSRIRDAGTGDALNPLQPLLGELTEINDYSKNYHHDQNPDADIYPISDGELKPFVDRTLDVISGVLAGRTT